MKMKKFVEKMEKKYPAFKFEVRQLETDYCRINVKLDAIGAVDVAESQFKEKKYWNKIGKAIVEKTIIDLQSLLDKLYKDSSKTVNKSVGKS